MENSNEIDETISIPTIILPGVKIRYVFDPETQRSQLVLVIDEFTDFKAINDNRKILKRLFKKIESAQGINLNYPLMGNMYGFYQWHKDGLGPKAMASILNYIGLALILCAYDRKPDQKNMDVYYDKEYQVQGFPTLSSNNATFPEHLFLAISMAAGITPEDSILYINAGHHSFVKNRIPWEIKDGPFNEQKLDSRLDYFKKQLDQKTTTISQTDAQLNRLDFVVYWLHCRDYFKKINDMLDKRGGDSWKRSNIKIKKRINQIIKNWETSSNPQIASLRSYCMEKIEGKS